MEDRHDRHRPGRARTLGVAGAVLIAGTLPAVVYGAAIAQLPGALAGLVLWMAACGAVAMIRGRMVRRRTDVIRGRGVARLRRGTPTPTEEPEHHPDPFEQLTMEPCDRCGADTLLGTCLDCTAIQQRRVDGSSRDDTDDRGD